MDIGTPAIEARMLKLLAPFWSHLHGHRAQLAALFGLGMLGAAAALTDPLIGKLFIDAVATDRNFSAVPRIASLLIALAVAQFLLGMVTRHVHAKLSAELLAELRERVFHHCLHQPLERVEAFRHGDLMTRLGSDIPRLQSLLVDGLIGGVRNILFLVVAAVILLNLSPELALWSFPGLVVGLALTKAFGGTIEHWSKRIRETMADTSHFLSERLYSLRSLRLHATRQQEEREFARLNQGLVRQLVRFQRIDSFASGLPGLTLTMSLAWIYLLGGRLLESGEITLGTFTAIVLYQGRLFSPAQGLLGLVKSLQESRVSLQRIHEVMGPRLSPPSSDSGPDDRPGELSFSDVHFAYPGKAPLLEGVDLRAGAGERIAVFGTSGAGKSTLVQLLCGLRIPTAGTVSLEGAIPTLLGEQRLHEAVGYCGAEPFLLHASVEQNLRYTRPDASNESLLTAARVAEAHEFILSLPHGYKTVIGGRGLALSDGQRQRIGIARLVLAAPRILLLDEAFSALDPDTERRVFRNLVRALPDRTIVTITHRLASLDTFERLYLLRDGRIRSLGANELQEAMNSLARDAAAARTAVMPE
jgi:ATP-binding cassette, subfamily B, bacterial